MLGGLPLVAAVIADDRSSGRDREGADDEERPGSSGHGCTVAANRLRSREGVCCPPACLGRRARERRLTRLFRAQTTGRYTLESNGDVQRAARAGQGRDRRGHGRGRPRAHSTTPITRSSSTCASRTSGRRVICPARSTYPRGNLESRIEALVPDKSREIVVVLRRRRALGVRGQVARRARLRQRLLADRRLRRVEAERQRVRDARRRSPPSSARATRATSSSRRSARRASRSCSNARVLLIGAGGLGSPSSLYLAAAGVGTLGIVDADVVDDSNLQRQIVHSTNTLGEPKVLSAKRTIEALNPDVNGDPLRGAAHVGERGAHPRRRLGRDRRRRGQLPDALPRQRRLRLARHPCRARLDLPLRGPGHGLPPARRARATAASTPHRRRPSSRRAARRAAYSASYPASSARCRRARRSS